MNASSDYCRENPAAGARCDNHRSFRRSRVAAVALGMMLCAQAGAQHWGYSGEAGPASWSSLDAKFVMCGLGRNQSPVDLADFVEAELEPLTLDYQAGAKEIVNNGHAIQVNYAPGSTLTLGGHSFGLAQFHFHSPSENTYEGKHFPLEAHLVHADDDGNLAVIALMFEEGEENSVIAQLWEQMPANAGGKAALSETMDVASLLPESKDYFRFNGSLTTPPCSEGVWWMVMKEPMSVSKSQIEKFSGTLGFANNRPVQPINSRVVLR